MIVRLILILVIVVRLVDLLNVLHVECKLKCFELLEHERIKQIKKEKLRKYQVYHRNVNKKINQKK